MIRENKEKMKAKNKTHKLFRNLLIEGGIYAIFAIGYVLVVIRFLRPYLEQYFESNLLIYGIASLFFIVLQGLFLEFVTSFLIERLGLERLE